MALQVPRKRFTVQEYYRMAETGVLREDDRVELIEGEILEMAPIGVRHATCVDRLNKSLNRLLPDELIVRVQSPIHLGDYSEPEPDITLLKPRDYADAEEHPGPSDILLLIEVSDTTLGLDRRMKVPFYARAGIAEVWIVNLQQDAIEVHSHPGGNAYRKLRRFHSGQSIPISGVGVALRVNDVIP